MARLFCFLFIILFFAIITAHLTGAIGFGACITLAWLSLACSTGAAWVSFFGELDYGDPADEAERTERALAIARGLC